MGIQLSKSARPPPPPKCSSEKLDLANWDRILKDTTNIYNQKKIVADSCSPEQAAARKLGGSSECQVNDVELGMAQKDVATRDAKWEQCYPEQAIQRKLRLMNEEANAYTTKVSSDIVSANNDLQTKLDAIEKLSASARELYKTLYDKEKELASVVTISQNNEQLERRERRAFLDNDPQGGVGGAPGVRTADDRSLLAFWICYGAAIIAVSILVLRVYGPQIGAVDIKSKVAVTTIIAAVAYGIAYYCISFYG